MASIFPCGCTRTAFKEWQFEILLKRRSEQHILEYLGLAEPFKGISTKIFTKCSKGHINSTACIGRYLYKRQACINCLLEEGKGCFMAHEWVGKKFQVDGGGELEIVKQEGFNVYSVCSICSRDKELFPLPFKQGKGDWGKRIPCGCGGQTKWNKEQWYILCKRKSKEMGNIFIGFEGEFKGCYTHIKQVCGKDPSHNSWNTSTVDKLIYSSRGCPQCAIDNSSFGLYEKRVDEEDNLYLIIFTSFDKKENFIKVGRTFDMQQRTSDYLKYYNIEVLDTIQDKHSEIRSLEKHIHKVLDKFHYTPLTPFGGSVLECFTMEALDSTIIKDTFNT